MSLLVIPLNVDTNKQQHKLAPSATSNSEVALDLCPLQRLKWLTRMVFSSLCCQQSKQLHVMRLSRKIKPVSDHSIRECNKRKRKGRRRERQRSLLTSAATQQHRSVLKLTQLTLHTTSECHAFFNVAYHHLELIRDRQEKD